MREAARPATQEDSTALRALHEQFVIEQASHRGGAQWLDEEGSAHDPLPLPTADEAAGRVVIVGTIDDVVLAFAVAEAVPTAGGSTVGRVRALYVEPDAREVGVGDVVIGAVVAWCAAHGCATVDAPAFPGARLTKNFFESHGFVARLLVMEHRIADLDSGA